MSRQYNFYTNLEIEWKRHDGYVEEQTHCEKLDALGLESSRYLRLDIEHDNGGDMFEGALGVMRSKKWAKAWK